jgi:hypothetical protein
MKSWFQNFKSWFQNFKSCFFKFPFLCRYTPAAECTFRPRTTRPPAYLTKSTDAAHAGVRGGGGGTKEQRYSERMMAIAAERQALWH